MKVALVIPTYNSAGVLPRLFEGVAKQNMKPDDIVVIDSNSKDETTAICEANGARVFKIGERKFNHGGTRRWASELTDADLLIYLTHDAVPSEATTFRNIVDALLSVDDSGAAYGRQLPYPEAGPLGRHHRLFNYPAGTVVKRLADAPRLKIRTCFLSDSFSAYRHTALDNVGGFPQDVVSCEDQFVSGQLLLNGYSIVYAGDATVYHSHDYSVVEEFRRYFDNGAFFSMNPWIMKSFGGTGGEGLRFVLSEQKYLFKTGNVHLMPKAAAATAAKYLGFKLGLNQEHLSPATKRKIGMFGTYWV